MLSIKRWDPSIGVNDAEFNKVMFWVEVHDLGLEKFSTENAQIIGNKIGKCVEIESNVESTQMSYMRL